MVIAICNLIYLLTFLLSYLLTYHAHVLQVSWALWYSLLHDKPAIITMIQEFIEDYKMDLCVKYVEDIIVLSQDSDIDPDLLQFATEHVSFSLT